MTARDLVRNALRMRPDRIVIGEVRGGEALDMMQAMNTGHDGSISTIHANSARDALSRLETMMLMAGINLPERALREQIASAMDVILQLTRLSDGSRKGYRVFRSHRNGRQHNYHSDDLQVRADEAWRTVKSSANSSPPV